VVIHARLEIFSFIFWHENAYKFEYDVVHFVKNEHGGRVHQNITNWRLPCGNFGIKLEDCASYIYLEKYQNFKKKRWAMEMIDMGVHVLHYHKSKNRESNKPLNFQIRFHCVAELQLFITKVFPLRNITLPFDFATISWLFVLRTLPSWNFTCFQYLIEVFFRSSNVVVNTCWSHRCLAFLFYPKIIKIFIFWIVF